MSIVTLRPSRDSKFAKVDFTGTGDNTVVAAVVGKRIRVCNYALVAAAGVNLKWKSGASTDLTGAMNFAANGGIVCTGDSGTVWFETAAGEALVLNSSAAIGVAGHVSYFEEG